MFPFNKFGPPFKESTCEYENYKYIVTRKQKKKSLPSFLKMQPYTITKFTLTVIRYKYTLKYITRKYIFGLNSLLF